MSDKSNKKLPSVSITSREILEALVVRSKEDSGPLKKRPERKSYILNLSRSLFKEQVDFIKDPSRRKAAICSRRSGKSYAAGRYLIQEALDCDNTVCVYIARTREAAKRILWTSLKQANQRYRLGIKFNNSDLIATFSNGSQIMFTGANDASDVDKLRGAAFSLAVLDEAAFFNIDLKELVNEVLSPALLDRDGSLVMISTPNSACTGFFYDITEKGSYNFSVHRWTIKENPYMRHAVLRVQEDIDNGILNPTDPAFKREYLGLWVRDNQDIVYAYSEDNLLKEVPESNDWEFVLGIDLGYHDATAFVVAAWSPDYPYLFFIDEHKEEKMLVSDVEEMIHRFMKTYNFSSIVMDTGGGSSRMVLETFKQRSSLPIKPAKKTGDKVGLMKMLNSDLKNEKIKIVKGMGLLKEWDSLQYNKSKTAEDRRYENHLSDAALYAWMESRHYLFETPEKYIDQGSPEWYKQLEDKIEERLLAEEYESKYDKDLWGVSEDTDLFMN